MSNLRLAAVVGFAAAALGATVFLETRTDAVASFRDQVGAETYSLADASDAVTFLKGEEPAVKVLLAMPDVSGVARPLPLAAEGWSVEHNIKVDRKYLMDFGRRMSRGLRPSVTAIWPAGTVVATDNGRVTLDEASMLEFYSGPRHIENTLYTNGTSTLLVSLERLDDDSLVGVRENELELVRQLGRETLTIGGNHYVVLSDADDPMLLIRGLVGDGVVIDIRGNAAASDVLEIIQRIDIDAFGRA